MGRIKDDEGNSKPGVYTPVYRMSPLRGSPTKRFGRVWAEGRKCVRAPEGRPSIDRGVNPGLRGTSDCRLKPLLAVLLLSFALAAPASAALSESGETFAALPARWTGFLTEHRLLRLIAVANTAEGSSGLLREQYLDSVARSLEARTKAPLDARRTADLGGLHIRLGDYPKAIEVLKAGLKVYNEDAKIFGNLAIAWHLSGDLDQAERVQEQVVRLCEKADRPTEELYLTLLRLRKSEARGETSPDRLFGIDWTRPVAPEMLRKLPPDAVGQVQRLALWLPADGRLLWLLGELSAAYGDVRTAAAIVDGCVSEFGMGGKVLRQRRQELRKAADAISALPDKDHDRYRGTIAFASSRPLLRTLDPTKLPQIRDTGRNPLPWPVVNETLLEKPFRPKFHDHLKKLDGKTVSLTGFLHPLSEEQEASGFLLLEYPVGCWFCEVPEPSSVIYVELAGGRSILLPRGLMQIEGTLKLNPRDPEDFLYSVTGATIRKPD